MILAERYVNHPQLGFGYNKKHMFHKDGLKSLNKTAQGPVQSENESIGSGSEWWREHTGLIWFHVTFRLDRVNSHDKVK